MSVRVLACVVFFSLLTGAQVTSKSVPETEAEEHIQQRVDPVVPTLAKAVRVGGIVKLQITISSSGDVVSVKTISGHPMLISAAIEAVKKWKYKPFEDNGKPIAVATSVEVNFPNGMSEEESTARAKFFPAEQACRELINQAKYSDAETRCREAVAISNQLPADIILERSDARSQLANSIFLQRRYSEAIPVYEEALKLDEGYRKKDDADLASDYWNLGRAYAMVGKLNKADELYGTAVSTFEAAIISLPPMKENYTQRLKRALGEYAQLKDLEGQAAAATELRRKATGI